MEFIVSSTEQLPEVARDILKATEGDRVYLFFGSMGAGKTTFIKALCSVLGVEDTVSSPTFSIVNEYTSPSELIYHFDFYRLKAETEALDLGYEDYLYSGNFCFIEWPEKIQKLLPEKFVEIRIEENGAGQRFISVNKKP